MSAAKEKTANFGSENDSETHFDERIALSNQAKMLNVRYSRQSIVSEDLGHLTESIRLISNLEKSQSTSVGTRQQLPLAQDRVAENNELAIVDGVHSES